MTSTDVTLNLLLNEKSRQNSLKSTKNYKSQSPNSSYFVCLESPKCPQEIQKESVQWVGLEMSSTENTLVRRIESAQRTTKMALYKIDICV